MPSDQDLYDSVEKALDKSTGILDGLRAYTGATEPIREVKTITVVQYCEFFVKIPMLVFYQSRVITD